MKLKQIIDAKESLEKIIILDLNVITSYKLMKLYKIVIDEYNNYKNIQDGKILKYGEKENDITIVKKTNENYQKYVNEMIELLNYEIKLEKITINMNEINGKISAIDLLKLESILEFKDG